MLKDLCECCHSDPALRERNLALSIFNAVRDSSSSANKNGGLLGMTGQTGSSAACEARQARYQHAP
jgi:hypothetical protein